MNIAENCLFKPPRSRTEINNFLAQFSFNVPTQYIQFFELTDGCQLFIDKEYGQWGLNLYDVSIIYEKNQQWLTSYRANELIFGDLIIGEFLGDSDLLILRCDNRQADYGNIIISLPIDTREDWYYLDDFSKFMMNFIQNKGAKFWEHHFQAA